MIVAAGKERRHGLRDRTLVLIAYRHALRVSELVALRWEQVDLPRGALHVNRRKNGEAATHSLSGTSFEPCVSSSARILNRRSWSLRNAADRSRMRPCGRSWTEPAATLASNFQSTHMLRQRGASTWQTTASTPAQSKRISASATSCTPCGTRSSHQIGFARFGAIDSPYEWPGSAKTG